MLSDLSDSDFDALASLTLRDASMGVVLAVSIIIMVMPFLFLVLALLPERAARTVPETDEGKVR